MTASFLAGSHQTIATRLPVVITKFVEPVILGATDFFERWRIIGGPPREAQSVFPINLTKGGDLDQERHNEVISGQKLSILSDVDPNPNNLVGAGILHTSVDGEVGCSLHFEPNREAKVRDRRTHSVFSKLNPLLFSFAGSPFGVPSHRSRCGLRCLDSAASVCRINQHDLLNAKMMFDDN
jgi:hypothetical protein